MSDFPTEIIPLILSKLPVKSLLRFKCVCKSWNSLIKNPNFIKLHLNQTLISSNFDNRYLLLYDTSIYCAEIDLRRKNHLFFSELRLPFKVSEVDFIGSSNGVICVTNSSKNAIFFYNPLTKSHYNVPSVPISNLSSNVTLFGFGYDSINDDYKVLRIVQGYDDDGVLCFEAKVFSYKKNSWKSVEGTSIPCFFAYKDVHGCLVNGVLHYVVFEKGKGEKDYLGMKMWIACFDLRSEKFSVLECPPWNHDNIEKLTDSDSLVLSLRELGGSLSAMKVFYVENQASNNLLGRIMCRADLWVMKEYGKKESWVRLFTKRFSVSEKHWFVVPIVYSKDGRKVMVHLDGTWFEWYDLGSKNVERFTVHGVPIEAIESALFVGSLVSFGDNPQSGEKTLPMKFKKKNEVDKFLSVGFKLRL